MGPLQHRIGQGFVLKIGTEQGIRALLAPMAGYGSRGQTRYRNHDDERQQNGGSTATLSLVQGG